MNEELRKKLAEWAGLRFGVFGGLPACITTDNLIVGPECPDFTNSLDACFKWLVPKVLEEYNIEFYSFRQDSGLYYSEVNVWRKGSTKHTFEVLQDEHIAKHFEQGADLDKITALALCLALEKLNDAGDKI